MADPPRTPFSFHSSKSIRDPKVIGLWTVGRTIGKGASGRVRIARHSKTGQYAAIKIISKSSLPPMMSQVSLNRLADVTEHVQLSVEREIVVMKLINHPNIMKLYDVWETSSDLYLVLEYVQGGELFDYLCTKGRLPVSEALSYFQQIISAVDYCHRFNIAHRDLKPENILLDEQSNIKIADFGMAAWQNNPHAANLRTSCGSPHYAAPEIIMGEPYNGAAADIWSCGVILHALLVGKLPFDDDDCSALLAKISRGTFTMPTDVPLESQDLLSRMLEKDVRKRITMSEITKHPFFMSQTPPETHYTLPDLESIAQPIPSVSALDPDIFANLRTLWHGTSDAVLIDSLINGERNWQKGIYHLLVDYRSRNPQIHDEDEEAVARLHKERKRRKQQRKRAKESASPTDIPPRAGPPTPRSAYQHNRLGIDINFEDSPPANFDSPMLLRPPPMSTQLSSGSTTSQATTSSLLAPFSPLWETLDLPKLTVPDIQDRDMQTFFQQIVTHLNVLSAKTASSEINAWASGPSNTPITHLEPFQPFESSPRVDRAPIRKHKDSLGDFQPHKPPTVEKPRYTDVQPLSIRSKSRRTGSAVGNKENENVGGPSGLSNFPSSAPKSSSASKQLKRSAATPKSIKIVEPEQVLLRKHSRHQNLPETPVSALSNPTTENGQLLSASHNATLSVTTPGTPQPHPNSTPKRTWLDTMFKMKAPNHTLYSRYGVHETRNECRRLLMDLDLLVSIEENERMGVLKCRSMEIQDPFRVHNVPKAIKFRVEGQRAPYHLSQEGITVALSFFHEKGSLDAFQDIFHALRAKWDLDKADASFSQVSSDLSTRAVGNRSLGQVY